MKKALASLLVAIMALGLAACATPASGETIKSEKPRATPVANPADQSALVAGNTAFAFDLYRVLRGGEGNLFYSPYSISAALAMTYAGARGETAAQMAKALRFALEDPRLHPAVNALDAELARRGQGARGKDAKGFRLNVVNAIWGQRNYRFLPAFLDTLATNYGAGLRILDFIGAPEPSRITINDWVADQTEERIKDLIPPGAIDTLTRLVLTNAIYFNAAWLHPFKAEATRNASFHLLDGKTATVAMMNQTESFGYAAGSGYRAVELPYDGGELSMLILLPDAGSFKDFEASLDAGRVNEIIAGMQPRQVALAMPKVQFESELTLRETLAKLGMPVAFTADADFSGMTGNRELYISEVVHKAFVSVDEAGTEAAAATAVIMKATAMPAEPVQVTIDRPFIFLIRDIKTGAVLFVGRVLSP